MRIYGFVLNINFETNFEYCTWVLMICKFVFANFVILVQFDAVNSGQEFAEQQ